MNIWSLLYPKTCLICKRWGRYICNRCAGRLRWLSESWCSICGQRSAGGITHDHCLRRGGLHGVTSSVVYTPMVRRMLSQVKYASRRDACSELRQLLLPHVTRQLRFYQRYPDLVIQPVPLHWKRERVRGFNQAQFLAEVVADVVQKPVISAVDRIRDTPHQVHTTSRVARSQNIRNAFQVTDGACFIRRPVLIVDDVFTTGSTVSELARTISHAGSGPVFVWTLARAVD